MAADTESVNVAQLPPDWCGTSPSSNVRTFQGPSEKEIVLEAVIQSLGEDAIATISPFEVTQPTPNTTKLPQVPSCTTQRPMPRNFAGGPAAIMVGLNAHAPRWKPGSVIRWAAWRTGFDNPDDATFAAEQLAIAAQTWNQAQIGVTFEWVAQATEATFVICHGGDKPGCIGEAFFPNANDLNYLFVYGLAFTTEWKGHLWRFLVHELGHILGLRHEFALEYGYRYEGRGAVQLGPRDELSVMNYRDEAPELQESDVLSTRAYYELQDVNGQLPRVGGTRIRDYVPM